MKYLQRLLAFIALCAAFFACQKEYSIEQPVGGANVSAQWEFKEGGVLFKGSMDTVEVAAINNFKFITIHGRSSDGAELTLQIYDTIIKTGSYKTPKSLLEYVKGGTYIYKTDQALADSFTIIITKIDSFSVAGTFSGKATKTIVDGKFSAIIKSSTVTPPASTDSGQVVLWSKAGCGGGTSTTPITVSVSNKSGQITTFGAEPTTCDPPGTFSVKLPVGTYPWVAKCGTDSVTGTVTVTKNGCTKQLVDLTKPVTTLDYFPMTANSNWTSKYDTSAALPGDTTFTFSKGTTYPAGGNTYNVFSYTDFAFGYDDTLYYRKAANTYYQYFKATTNILGFDTPQAVEIPFLKDDVIAGTSFSSATYSGTITSPANGPIAVQQRVDGTILEKVASVTVGGKTYNDVIKVRLIYQGIIGGSTTEIYREEEWFAKGIGLIRYLTYYDAPYTTPTYILNLTRSNIVP